METSIQVLAAINFFVVGVSHILQPRAWVEFFVMLREKGAAGNFANAFLHLAPGSLIVSFHNVWQGVPTVLTVIGWGYVLKSLLFFAFPRLGLAALANVREDRAKLFVVPGVLLVAVSALLGYSLLGG